MRRSVRTPFAQAGDWNFRQPVLSFQEKTKSTLKRTKSARIHRFLLVPVCDVLQSFWHLIYIPFFPSIGRQRRNITIIMPRGKNYVNNNRGVFLKGPKKGVMESCYYGASCTRKGCIYRHDVSTKEPNQSIERSTEPCMAFLAGICTFSTETCRKRHPSSAEEQQELIAQFQRTLCRFGTQCKTNGCLFQHTATGDDAAFPPLPGAAGLMTAPPIFASAWRAAPPTSHLLHPPPSHFQPPPPPAPTDTDKTPELNIQAKEFVPGGWS
jgi:hypothetical protein